MKLAILALFLAVQSWAAASLNLSGDISAWTGTKYLAIIGDSLGAGGGACGLGVHVLPRAVTNSAGIAFTYTNGSIGGYRWTNTWTALTLPVLATRPRIVLAVCGRNDMLGIFPSHSYPDYWTNFSLPAINAIYTNCVASNALLVVCDILPYYTNGFAINDENSYDTGYQLFCATNAGAYYMQCRCPFGLTNFNYGACDALNPLYFSCGDTSDPLHINQAGYDLWGPIIFAELETICYRPRSVSRANMSSFSMR